MQRDDVVQKEQVHLQPFIEHRDRRCTRDRDMGRLVKRFTEV